MSTIGTGRSREGACVLLSATAEAKVFKSYDDVLKSGDKATIVAMQAALQKAGPGEAKLLDDGEPSVLVWFSGPPYYYPLETGGTLEADGLPSGGTFEWSCDPEATGESAWFPGDTAGHLTVTVTYHSGGESSTAQCDVTIFDGDVDMAGVVDADPPQEDPPGPDLDPGGMVGPMGPRRAITLTWDPNDLLPVDEAGDHHWWSAALSVQPVGKLQFWDAAVDGNEVTQLGWSGHHAPQWHGDTVPDTLYVAPVPAASGAAVHVTFTCGARCLPRSPTAYEDEVVLNLMEARLQALANDAQEEDPGVFLGVGGMKLMSILKPLPVAALHGTDLVKLSWTNGDKVHVWDDAQKTQAITNGQTFAISDLNEGTGFAQRDLYVEGVAASEGLRDIVFTLQYPAEDPITDDVVKFTVVQADLDVEGLNEAQEDDPGPLVGRRHDGNEAPRRKITLQKVLPEAWTGGVSLMALPPDDRLKVYDAAEGGNEVDCDGHGNELPSAEPACGPVGAGGRGQRYHARRRPAPADERGGYAHDDVHFTVVDVDLEAPGVQESDEENPGVLLGVGATHALTVHDPQPSGHLPADSELQVSWTGDAYVDVWKDAGCTEAVGNPATFTLAELRAPGSPWTQLYVEGKDTSGQARDVSITLRYLHPAFQPEDQPIDVVNLTVLSTDLDISDIADGEEENPGAFLVRRHDGNGAPRVEIMLGAVSPVGPEPWDGDVLLQRLSSKVKVFDAEEAGNEVTFNGADNRFHNAALVANPQHLWVEGVSASGLMRDVVLVADMVDLDGGEDRVKFTVLDVNLEVCSLSEESEESSGAFLEVNYDDDNGNGQVDSLEEDEVTNENDLQEIKLYRPSPADLPAGHHVRLTWTPDAKVDVFEGPDRSGPVECGKEYTLDQLTTPKTLYAEGDLPSDALRDVVFELQYVEGGENATDEARVTVWQISLKSVEFSGENENNGEFHSVYVDGTDQAYEPPHWQDNSNPLDGDAEDWAAPTGDRQYPVCYVRNTKPKATVKVLIAPHDWFKSGRPDQGRWAGHRRLPGISGVCWPGGRQVVRDGSDHRTEPAGEHRPVAPPVRHHLEPFPRRRGKLAPDASEREQRSS